MNLETLRLALTLGTVFLAVALVTGIVTWFVLSRRTVSRRRLGAMVQSPPPSPLIDKKSSTLSSQRDPLWDRVVKALPTSRGTNARLDRELALAGFKTAQAAALFSIAEIVCPIVFAAIPLILLEGNSRVIGVIAGGLTGYLAPGMILRRRINARQREIQNGLADALDLLVLCLEAGSSLDQAIVKASEELDVSYPALGDQLRILISEMRAGRSRLDAFRGLADRTRVDDVRALVAMLVQTDRFGTSVAQALRTHSEVCRSKRRQRAEERAQKVGVKLVFPLVFCLFPALYVVMLGPAFLQFMKVFANTGAR